MSHLPDCKDFLTGLPASTPLSYNLLSTQQPGESLKNELVYINPLLKPLLGGL